MAAVEAGSGALDWMHRRIEAGRADSTFGHPPGRTGTRGGIPRRRAEHRNGIGETAGAALAAHDDVDKVAFTGFHRSRQADLARRCGKSEEGGNLELGGKSPNVVFKDADLKAAVETALPALSSSTKASAAAPGHDSSSRKMCSTKWWTGFRSSPRKIKLGSGLEPDTTMGPLVSQNSSIAWADS